MSNQDKTAWKFPIKRPGWTTLLIRTFLFVQKLSVVSNRAWRIMQRYGKNFQKVRNILLLMDPTFILQLCGKPGARIRFVTRSYGKGDDLLVIENIPVISCHHCGESYLAAETSHEIERIKLHRKKFAEQRQVSVAKFT